MIWFGERKGIFIVRELQEAGKSFRLSSFSGTKSESFTLFLIDGYKRFIS